MRALLLILSLGGLVLACGNASDPAMEAAAEAPDGAAIYNAQCANCHGRKGDLCMAGAKDLRKSTLSRADMVLQISTGKGAMMGYATILTKKEISAVADHVMGLRAVTP